MTERFSTQTKHLGRGKGFVKTLRDKWNKYTYIKDPGSNKHPHSQGCTLTQKLWFQLRRLGKGLSKHKWTGDKGRGGRWGRGGRFGSLFKCRGSWEERSRLNRIQYGTQAVTCNMEDNGNTGAFSFTILLWKAQHTDTSLFLSSMCKCANSRTERRERREVFVGDTEGLFY